MPFGNIFNSENLRSVSHVFNLLSLFFWLYILKIYDSNNGIDDGLVKPYWSIFFFCGKIYLHINCSSEKHFFYSCLFCFSKHCQFSSYSTCKEKMPNNPNNGLTFAFLRIHIWFAKKLSFSTSKSNFIYFSIPFKYYIDHISHSFFFYHFI